MNERSTSSSSTARGQLFGELLHLDRLLAAGVDRHSQEVRDRHARNRDRVLEGEEEAELRALVRLHLDDVLSVEENLAVGDLVGRVSHDRVRERRLAGAVGPHQRVQFAVAHGEVDTAQDLAILGAHVQVADLELCCHYAATAFLVVVGISSARVVCSSVLTIEPRTRVHSSFVVQTCSGSDSRVQRTVPSGELEMHSTGAIAPLERLDHLGHRDLRRLACEQVPAVGAAAALDQAGPAQARNEVLEVGERQALMLGDLGERNGLARRRAERARPSRARRTRTWLRTSSQKTLSAR